VREPRTPGVVLNYRTGHANCRPATSTSLKDQQDPCRICRPDRLRMRAILFSPGGESAIHMVPHRMPAEFSLPQPAMPLWLRPSFVEYREYPCRCRISSPVFSQQVRSAGGEKPRHACRLSSLSQDFGPRDFGQITDPVAEPSMQMCLA